MTDLPEPFVVDAAPLDGTPGVRVQGEVDIGTAPQLADALDAALRDAAGTFVVDLSDVRFLDSTGISALVRARAVLGQDDRRLVLVCPPGPVRRILAVAGVEDLFAIFDTRDAAGAGLR